MPPRKPKKSESSSGPVTRSRSGSTPSKQVDVTFYTKIRDGDGALDVVDDNGFQVVSKRKLKSDPKNYQRLKDSMSKVQQWEQQHGKPVQIRVEKPDSSPIVIYVTHLNLFLYATCFFIQSGTLPYLTKKLGADPIVFGQLQTAFAIAQLCGGPIYGRLGDLMGERIVLVLAFASAATSYLLMGIATSVQVLFVSRIFSVLLHVMQGSQMIVAFLSAESERASSLAKLGFSYGIGMVVGPSLGGFITKHYGEQEAALIASLGSVVSLILVVVFVPNVPKQKTSSGSVLNLKEILRLLFLPGVFYLLLVKLVSGVPIGILQSMFSIIAIEQFGLAPDQTGMVVSYVGAISLVMQGFGIGAITKRFPDKSILQFATFTLVMAYFILTLVRDIQDFMMLLLPLTCSMCLIHCILTAALTKTVPKSCTGQMLGLNMAVHSTIRSFAPSVGGYMIASYGMASLGAVGVIANLVVLAMTPFANLKPKM